MGIDANHRPRRGRLPAIFAVALGGLVCCLAGIALAGPPPADASDPSALTRWMMGFDGQVGDPKEVVALLGHPNDDVVVAAALALSRTSMDASAQTAIAAVLTAGERSVEVRRTCAFALGAATASESLEVLLLDALRAERFTEVAAETLRTIGRVGGADSVSAVAERAAVADSVRWREREAALVALGRLAFRTSPYLPDDAQRALLTALDAKEPAVRAAAAWALSQAPNGDAYAALARNLTSGARRVRRAAAAGLSVIDWLDGGSDVVGVLLDDSVGLDIRLPLAAGLARQSTSAGRSQFVEWLRATGPAVFRWQPDMDAAALNLAAMAALQGAWHGGDPWEGAHRVALVQLYEAWTSWLSEIEESVIADRGETLPADVRTIRWGHLHCVLASMLDATAGRRTDDCGPSAFSTAQRAQYQLRAWSLRPSFPTARAEALLGHRNAWARAASVAALGWRVGLTPLQLARALDDESALVVAEAARYAAGLSSLDSRVARSVRGAATRFAKSIHVSTQVELANALARDSSPEATQALQAAACQLVPSVSAAARDGLRKRSVALRPCASGKASEASLTTFRAVYSEDAANPRTLPRGAVVTTDVGRFDLVLDAEASPNTVAHFAKLVAAKAYRGRVVQSVRPGRTAVLGARSSRGVDGTQALVWDEVGPSSWLQGEVGMALAGADSASASFFVLQSEQPQLDGNYTAFARVSSGHDVVARLVPGDRIVDVRLVGTGESDNRVEGPKSTRLPPTNEPRALPVRTVE